MFQNGKTVVTCWRFVLMFHPSFPNLTHPQFSFKLEHWNIVYISMTYTLPQRNNLEQYVTLRLTEPYTAKQRQTELLDITRHRRIIVTWLEVMSLRSNTP